MDTFRVDELEAKLKATQKVVVKTNGIVRDRDQRIAELEAENARLREALTSIEARLTTAADKTFLGVRMKKIRAIVDKALRDGE